VLPDIAICPECTRDLRLIQSALPVPFTNWTNCGPRFSITEALPYDRSHDIDASIHHVRPMPGRI
jgi:hydrogenase maturation protein HypF